MIFVKREELQVGMRLARPVYNKNGVLLYERNSKLTSQGIDSIRNFGLIGMFILEPAEPAPPMTQEDIEFERFQTMTVFLIQEELNKIMMTKKSVKLQTIVASILKSYGHLDHKIHFIQNLRSKDDCVCKHALNVAILSAMICHKMNLKREDQQEIVSAAILHDMGELTLNPDLWEQEELSDMDLVRKAAAQRDGINLIGDVFSSSPNMKRICFQCNTIHARLRDGQSLDNMKVVPGAKVLLVANQYDEMTAMQYGRAPESEVAVLRYMQERPEIFDPDVVEALADCIQILMPGISVELSNGDKALVIQENPHDILHPMVLSFSDNSIIDLGNRFIYGDIEIVDIMKTMDNRHIMDTESLRRQGFQVEEPDYVPAKEES